MWDNIHEFQVDNVPGSFVGLKRQGGRLVFCLPKGCDAIKDSFKRYGTGEDDQHARKEFDKITEFFFQTYRVISRFYELNKGKDRCKLATTSDPIHDPSIQTSGCVLEDGDGGEPALFYSKLSLFDDIMNQKEDLEYSTLGQMPRTSQEIDYSQIHLHLHKAIFLDTETNHPIAYLPEFESNQPVILNQATDLVRMLCFFYEDIARFLPQYEVSPRIAELAAEFRSRYLTPTASFFSYDTHRATLLECREVLDKIDRNTGYKSDEYWNFFETAETFLYGRNRQSEDGKEWGIENFSWVWEDLCHSWLLENKKIQYADTQIEPRNNQRFVKKANLGYVFKINWGDKNRVLRPDCVYYDEEESLKKWHIIDLKYWNKDKQIGIKDLVTSIVKQQLYQACLHSYLSDTDNEQFVTNAFVIPDLFDDDPPIKQKQPEHIHGISDWHGDYRRLSECYLNLEII